MKSPALFMLTILLGGTAMAQELPVASDNRLPIEVLPIIVHWYNPLLDGAADAVFPPSYQARKIREAFGTVREGLSLLGVESDEYDLRLSDDPAPVLTCRMMPLGWGVYCQTETGGHVSPENIGPMMIEEFDYLRKASRYRGTVLLGILILPESEWLEWTTFYGQNNYWHWDGGRRWQDRSCVLWSVPWLKTVAHELGHCFNLYHPDEDPDPYADIDNTIDLMEPVSSGNAHQLIRRLKTSNYNRVRRHFGDTMPGDSSDIPPGGGDIPPGGGNDRLSCDDPAYVYGQDCY